MIHIDDEPSHGNYTLDRHSAYPDMRYNNQIHLYKHHKSTILGAYSSSKTDVSLLRVIVAQNEKKDWGNYDKLTIVKRSHTKPIFLNPKIMCF